MRGSSHEHPDGTEGADPAADPGRGARPRRGGPADRGVGTGRGPPQRCVGGDDLPLLPDQGRPVPSRGRASRRARGAGPLPTEQIELGGEYLRTLWGAFAENMPLLRHQLASDAGRDMRAARFEASRQWFVDAIESRGVDPDSDEGRRLVRLALLLTSSPRVRRSARPSGRRRGHRRGRRHVGRDRARSCVEEWASMNDTDWVAPGPGEWTRLADHFDRPFTAEYERIFTATSTRAWLRTCGSWACRCARSRSGPCTATRSSIRSR